MSALVSCSSSSPFRASFLQVHEMLSCWQQLFVVTTSVMPSDLTRALLEAGAKAVVCCRADALLDDDPVAVAEFMAAFYQRLLSGRPIVSALTHAGETCDSENQSVHVFLAVSPDDFDMLCTTGALFASKEVCTP